MPIVSMYCCMAPLWSPLLKQEMSRHTYPFLTTDYSDVITEINLITARTLLIINYITTACLDGCGEKERKTEA